MLMSVFFILLMEPVQVIKLENNGLYLSRQEFNRAFLEVDDTYITATKYQIWHWDKDGKLINRFGQKGRGPGEFEGVGSIFWTGEYYWVIDNVNLTSSLFDRSGQFVSRTTLYFRQFVRSGSKIFAVDYSRVNQRAKNYPPTLQEIFFSVENNEIKVDKTDLVFYKVSERQMGLEMNFKLLWVVNEGSTYYVVNQVEPRIYIYDEEARRLEAATDIMSPFEPRFTPMNLAYWEDPPQRITKGHKSGRAFVVWWKSWSRINYFNRLGDDYVVAYEVPDPEDATSTLQAVVRLGRDGFPKSKPLMVNGFCLGTRGSRVYFMREGDDDDVFEYFVDIYDLSNS